jgi:hypothetical protein
MHAYKQATIGFVLESGVKVVFPLIRTGSGGDIFKHYQSTFAGCYGDLIADGHITSCERHQIYNLVYSSASSINITSNPYCVSSIRPEMFSEVGDFTQIIDLRKGYEQIWSEYKHCCKKGINKGEKKGFKVRLADTASDIFDYYEIYRKNLEFWGKSDSGYPIQLFKELVLGLESSPKNSVLWLITSENDQIVGGNLVFYYNKHAVEWHAVFARDYFQWGVRNYLLDHIIKDACSKNFSIYDFNPSGGYEGVVNFKSTFGAEKRSVTRWRYTSGKLKIAYKCKAFFA